jgi:TolB-like protein
MSEPAKAVFLSYAREDSAAAQRLADALRAFGIEVWFDQSELRGGDSWDTKIRTQIKSCTLFIPIVSAQTEARGEGYFRREWKLAVDRTHDMGAGRAFLVPVVIDDTKESGADVPEEFLRYQWIRLSGGAPTPQFVEQINRLLVLPRQTVGRGHRTPPESVEAAAAPARAPAGFGDPALQSRPASRWPLVLGGVAAVAIVAALFFAWRGSKPDQPVAGVADPGPAAAKPTAVAAPATSPTSAADAKSLAVLPFANMSEEKDAAFFADGVHEDLLTALAKVRDLKVISRTSVLGYRDATKRNLRQIAEELGVAHVLEGSVRRAGNKARITVQLIDARTDQHLWAESYDRDISDIFAVQGEVAREITTALKATLTPNEQKLIGRQLTTDAQAYELYARARALLQEVGERGAVSEYEKIISLLDQAAARDPGFVLAYVQAAQIHSILYWFGTMDPSPARAAKMKAAVDAAVRLAPDLPEVRMARGAYVYRIELDWNAALAEFRAAEAGLPNDAQLKFWLAVTNRRLGRWQEAMDYFAQSIAVNPRDLTAAENWVGFQTSARRFAAVLDAVGRIKATGAVAGTINDDGALARFVLKGDRAAFSRELAALASAQRSEVRLYQKLRSLLVVGDLAGADRLLAETPAGEVSEEGSRVLADPVPYHRAIIAYARGDRAAAQEFATAAERIYRARTWTKRQQPWVRMRLAMCAALSGRADEAAQEAYGAMADARQQDAFAAVLLRDQHGAVLLLAGRREEAFAVLREAMETPVGMPAALYRIDPLWSSLAGDPQFEAILRLQKSL